MSDKPCKCQPINGEQQLGRIQFMEADWSVDKYITPLIHVSHFSISDTCIKEAYNDSSNNFTECKFKYIRYVLLHMLPLMMMMNFPIRKDWVSSRCCVSKQDLLTVYTVPEAGPLCLRRLLRLRKSMFLFPRMVVVDNRVPGIPQVPHFRRNQYPDALVSMPARKAKQRYRQY